MVLPVGFELGFEGFHLGGEFLDGVNEDWDEGLTGFLRR